MAGLSGVDPLGVPAALALCPHPVRPPLRLYRQVYLDLDFTLMEMNPFTLDAAGQPFPLDMRGELDDTAAFRRWAPCEPPHACGLPSEDGHCLAGAQPLPAGPACRVDPAALCHVAEPTMAAWLGGVGWCWALAPGFSDWLPARPASVPPRMPAPMQCQEVGRRRVPVALWPHHDAAGGLARCCLLPGGSMRVGGIQRCRGGLQGRNRSPLLACRTQEAAVHSLDEATGASLKLSILNPRGRIWTMVAGGLLAGAEHPKWMQKGCGRGGAGTLQLGQVFDHLKQADQPPTAAVRWFAHGPREPNNPGLGPPTLQGAAPL